MTQPDDAAAALGRLRDQLQRAGGTGLRQAFEETLHPADGADHRRHFPIADAGEALVEIPPEEFPRHTPHQYSTLGAPYPDYSPYHCRASVLRRLRAAQQQLRALREGWSIQIFDAYRPLAAQHFMVEHEFTRLTQLRGFEPAAIPAEIEEAIWQEVFSVWARPDHDPAMPTPHSTGAALDVTLVDEHGAAVDTGSAIDAFGAVSRPNHFALRSDHSGRQAHANRTLLHRAMATAGFQRHPFEWWHFSYGDQLWALMCWLDAPERPRTALFGAARPG